MTTMIAKLYDALVLAGAEEPKARTAAEAIARTKTASPKSKATAAPSPGSPSPPSPSPHRWMYTFSLINRALGPLQSDFSRANCNPFMPYNQITAWGSMGRVSRIYSSALFFVTLSTFASAHNVDLPSIIGIKLGMPEDEVVAIIRSFDPKLKIHIVVESLGFMQKETYHSAIIAQFNSAIGDDQTIVVRLTKVGSKAVEVIRNVRFNPNHRVSIMTVQSGIKKLYGDELSGDKDGVEFELRKAYGADLNQTEQIICLEIGNPPYRNVSYSYLPSLFDNNVPTVSDKDGIKFPAISETDAQFWRSAGTMDSGGKNCGALLKIEATAFSGLVSSVRQHLFDADGSYRDDETNEEDAARALRDTNHGQLNPEDKPPKF